MRANALHFLLQAFIAAVLSAAFAVGVAAQSLPTSRAPAVSSAAIMGKVVLPDGSFLSQAVRIRLETARGVNSSVFTDSDGKFQFTDLTSGTYQLVIDGDKDRFDTTIQRVEVVRGMPVLLTVVLKEKKSDSKPSMRGSVSSSELDQQIPAKARKEFEEATRATNAGKLDEAIAHFRNAIAIYPHYVMARNDLGAQLMAQQKLDEAEKELRAAVDLDNSAFNPTLNLGIVLFRKHQFVESASLLNRAVSLQPSSPAARLYHGLALGGVSSFDEAAEEFKKAYGLGGKQFAIALFYLGELYMDKGDRQLARQYLEQYLHDAPHADNAEQAQRLIALLN